MNTNKEVKIAIAVGIIMITICLVIFIFYKSSTKIENLDLKIYKLYEIEGKKDEHEYRECKVTTDKLLTISKEFKRAERLKESDQVIGKQITGNYKLISGEEFIAFDAGEEDYIYRSDTKRLYSFDSKIYDYVVEVCK